MTRVHSLAIAVAFSILLVVPFTDAHAASIPSVPDFKCEYNCGSPKRSRPSPQRRYSPQPPPYSGPSPAERRRRRERQRERTLHNLSERGYAAYQRGDYANAIYNFKEALKLEPYNLGIKHNLKRVRELQAKKIRRKTQERKARKRARDERLKKLLEENRKKVAEQKRLAKEKENSRIEKLKRAIKRKPRFHIPTNKPAAGPVRQ